MGNNKNVRREFTVDTPVGRLKISAKSDYGNPAAITSQEDNPDDFPGVYVDLVMPNGSDLMLACVEWESVDRRLQACVYGNCTSDDPSDIVYFEDLEDEINGYEGE